MTEPQKTIYRRRIVYIEKSFQRQFIIRFCLVALAAMAVASAIIYLLSMDTVTASYSSSHLVLEKTSDAIMATLVITNLAVLVAFIIVTIFVTLYVSFKIGGPLYRFQQDMALLGQGRVAKRIRLRRNDQLQKFASEINSMAEGLEGRVRRLQDLIGQVKELTEKEDWDREGVKKAVGSLHEAATTLFDQAG
jgi:methyl-accepting chemotaxis protein